MSTSTRRVSIARKRLLQRLRIVEPRLLWLIAPAGFGKTTFANAVLAKSARHVTCDCLGVRDSGDFARRVLDALGREAIHRSLSLFDQRFDVVEDDAQGPARAVEAWERPADVATFYFENAADIAEDPATIELFGQLLARPHATRRVVVASRARLDVPASGFAPPNEILTLDGRELAFDSHEIRALFGASP